MKFIILRGLSGSGKSTWAKKLADAQFNSVICSADDYFVRPSGHYFWDGTKLAEAHAACKLRFEQALEDKAPLILLDNTNVKTCDWWPYVEAARAASFEVSLLQVMCDPVVAWTRSKHKIPYSQKRVITLLQQPIPEDLEVTTVWTSEEEYRNIFPV